MREQYESTIKQLLLPLVEDKENLRVKQLSSLDENKIEICVYANKEDTAKLIGKHGSMADAIYHVLLVASTCDNKKISIQYESY